MGNDPEKEIRILIADDHPIFRDGFKLHLKKLKQHNILFVAEAGDGKELTHLTTQYNPDIVITDIQMPIMNGIEATRLIKNSHPHIQIIALSMFNEEDLVVDMLEAGASGYLLKNTSCSELHKAIQIIMQGGVYFTPETAVHLNRTIKRSIQRKNNEKKIHLSGRELEIIQMICKGKINKEMAADLRLSIRTIEGYRENIYEKTDTRSAVEVAIYAIKQNLIDLGEL